MSSLLLPLAIERKTVTTTADLCETVQYLTTHEPEMILNRFWGWNNLVFSSWNILNQEVTVKLISTEL